MDRCVVGRVRLVRSAVVAVVLFGAVACGDSDDGADATAPSITSEAGAAGGSATTAGDDAGDAGGAADPSGGDTVLIEGFTFEPATVEVASGTTVTWTNRDGVPHTVTAGLPDEEVTGFHEPVDGGATVEVTFDEAGTFPYYCVVHPTMTGEVVVS